jgi:hypothetical protein
MLYFVNCQTVVAATGTNREDYTMRISKIVLNNHAKGACEAIGLDVGDHYEKGDDGHYHAVIGRVALNKGMSGWDLEQVVNDGGAIRQINGWCNQLSASEMLAFCNGITYAARALKSEG